MPWEEEDGCLPFLPDYSCTKANHHIFNNIVIWRKILKMFLRWVLRTLFFCTFWRSKTIVKQPGCFRFWKKKVCNLKCVPSLYYRRDSLFPRGNSFHLHAITLILVYVAYFKCSLWNLYQQGNHSGFNEWVIPYCLEYCHIWPKILQVARYT